MTLYCDTNELVQISTTTSALGGRLLPWLKQGICADTPLGTKNLKDFNRFMPFGLRIGNP
ncbi:MAG: hypothetical protein OSA84_01090 [Akkermansiaceae bacterium]|nr:hypothetical protein [Akkermansiaceae bacterium]